MTVISYEFIVDGESQGLKEIKYVNPYEAIIACISLISNEVNFAVKHEEHIQ